MPVLMPQAFQRHSVYASIGVGRGVRRGISTSGTNPVLLIPQGLQLPQNHTPGGGHLYQCRPQCPHVPHGSASLAQNPNTHSYSAKICGLALTEMGDRFFFPVTGPCPAVFQFQ